MPSVNYNKSKDKSCKCNFQTENQVHLINADLQELEKNYFLHNIGGFLFLALTFGGCLGGTHRLIPPT